MEAQPPAKKPRYDDSLVAGGAPSSAASLEYPKMRVSELRAELKKRGLKCSGNKPDLIERLENDDNPIEFYDMAGEGKDKWLMVWMRVMMNLNHDPLFYSVFQGAINQVLNPLMHASTVVVHSGHVFEDMLEQSMKGKGKASWNEITEKQLQMGQMYAAAHNNEFSIEDDMDDDGAEEDPDKEEVHLNKIGGFKLLGLRIGPFHPKSCYPQQFRVKANVKKQQLEIYLFRFVARRGLPKPLAKYGARPSKQLAEVILKECNRFEVSRWFRIIIPFNSITGLHLYRNTPDENNMITGTEGMGFLAFDLSTVPVFQTRRACAQMATQNEWRERSDFTKGKAASKPEGKRYYLFGDSTELAILVAMIALSKPDISVQELLDRGLADAGSSNNFTINTDSIVDITSNSLPVPSTSGRPATVPRPNFADLRQPLSHDVIAFLAENKLLDLSMVDGKTRKMVSRCLKEKGGVGEEEEEEEEDEEEEEEDEEEIGRSLYKNIISGTNTCFTDFVARNHNNVEAIKKTLSEPIDPSKYGFNNGMEDNHHTSKTVLDYVRSFVDPTAHNNSQVYFSFCYGNFVDKQHGSHCEVCGLCADWRRWHCWNCNRCTDSQTLPVCEHCGNSSMPTSGAKKTRPASWRETSMFATGEFENGEDEDDEAVRELCISDSDDDEPPWPEPDLKTEDANKIMLMTLLLGARSGAALPDQNNFQPRPGESSSDCLLQ